MALFILRSVFTLTRYQQKVDVCNDNVCNDGVFVCKHGERLVHLVSEHFAQPADLCAVKDEWLSGTISEACREAGV